MLDFKYKKIKSKRIHTLGKMLHYSQNTELQKANTTFKKHGPALDPQTHA